MKKASIIRRRERGTHPQGGPQEAELVLKHGAKGTGADIQVVLIWPWSPQSVDQAYNILYDAARQVHVEIV